MSPKGKTLLLHDISEFLTQIQSSYSSYAQIDFCKHSFFSPPTKLTADTSCVLSLLSEQNEDCPLVSSLSLETFHHDPMLCEPDMYPDEDAPTYFSSPEQFLYTEALQEDSELPEISFQEFMSFPTQTCGSTF